MHTTQIHVTGMTCGHCVHSVSEELNKIEGVLDTSVDLETGLVTINSQSPIVDEILQKAVNEAGYQIQES